MIQFVVLVPFREINPITFECYSSSFPCKVGRHVRFKVSIKSQRHSRRRRRRHLRVLPTSIICTVVLCGDVANEKWKIVSSRHTALFRQLLRKVFQTNLKSLRRLFFYICVCSAVKSTLFNCRLSHTQFFFFVGEVLDFIKASMWVVFN